MTKKPRPHATLSTADRVAWHAFDQAAVEQRMVVDRRGLILDEVDARQRWFGSNELQEEPPTSVFSLLHQFRRPLIYIQLLAALVTLVLQE